jgi:uncharacterized protein YkwD
MRKPLLVVCGVTLVALIGGGIAATQAGAEETPDPPAVPGLQLPAFPAFPQFPGFGADSDAGPVGATGSDDQQASNDGDQTGDDQTGNDQSGDTNTTSGDNRFPDRPGGHAAAAADKTQPKPASLTTAAQRELSPAAVSTSATAPFQQQVLALINQNRRQGGCQAVSLDRRLILAAYGHATDMARRNYFAHESLNGEGAGDRVTDAGFQWSRYGENIARGPSSAYEVVDGWMHSPEHRENIMDCRFREMGIGLAFSGDKESYWVQDFATPRP